MKVKSFFIYTFGLQISSVIFLWLLLVGWLQFFYWPSIHDELNAQQNIVTQGFAKTLDVVADKPEYFNKIADNLQELYSSAMESGDNISYRPFMVVRDKQGNVYYRNSDKLHVPSLKSVSELAALHKDWHFTSAWNDQKTFEVVIAESYSDRKSLLGNPAEGTAIPLAFILGIMLLAILITAYFSLRPLRQSAKLISSRQPGNLTPIETKEQYKEIRPIIAAINNLMSRVDAANQREKRFMADAAHELRTPIAAVIAQLHLLMQIDNPKEKGEIINDMQETLNRAASLSHQLIDLARLETEDFLLNKEQVDLPALISHLISSHIPYAINKDIDVELQSPKSFYILTDKLALSNIFTNLLENAIKYCPEKGKIKVILKDLTPFGGTISVQDNGRGIPEDSRQLIFSRFYRVPGTMETGSGLGLSIAQNLAHKIGAVIRVTDGLDNQGIGFIIDLP
ncbi:MULTISPECIES: sensor histidine kinase [Providencia]|uniref:histidine kinase n=1 Tax=Providencia rettgeri TaxID=587 RepID=A0A9N8CXC0_PRORE|nr:MULTISPECIES: HAMP domain-containing sensor histidine kinase [Providencia]EFE53871.1 putative swarming motility regulation sensor protein RssA [Providencia rettgeri DSM 1131]MBG5893300.1 HAMP domain-containing histidine kinase [Providencia rettgeri]MBG5927598.1 HAMP domain-containing histidine kinase [Providencia rettgeri]MBN7842365.1 HAMP domain-containing histidine kinase [Providencia rettgeri]MBN7853432.1 HAMP domain-containing histidine kinase [Providencia rettgeri]